MPESYDKVNGFFYVSVRTMVAVSWSPQVVMRNSIAMFAEPASELFGTFNQYSPWDHGGTFSVVPGGNISAGTVMALSDTVPLFETSEFTIQYRLLADTIPVPDEVPGNFTWRFSGNKSFAGAIFQLASPFAKISGEFDTLECFSGTDKVIRLDSILDSSDSVAIGFVKPGLWWSWTGIRSYAGELSSVTLRKEEINWLRGALAERSVTHISVRGIRYYHKWEQGRLFLFVFSSERQVPVVFKD